MRVRLDITDLLEFLCTAPVLHGVQNVSHHLIQQLPERSGAQLIGYHPIYGRPFSVDIADIGQDTLCNLASFKSFFGLDGRHPVKSRSAIRNRHPNRPLRRGFEELKRVLRRGSRALRAPDKPLHLHRTVEQFEIAAGDVVIVPGLNVWYPEYNRDLGAHTRTKHARLAAVLHDFGPVTEAQYFPHSYRAAFRDWMESLLPHADLLIAYSQHTQHELQTLCPALAKDRRRVVIPLAHEFLQGGDSKLRREVADLCAGRYALYVGRIEPRKNILALVRVWARLARELGSQLPDLVLAGRMNFPGNEFSETLDSIGPAASKIRLLKDLTTAELARLYSNCRFTVYPSFYEGWGLPVGEAASFGKVTAASRAASIPEVLGDLAVYFDPGDEDDMATVLHRLVTDNAYLTGLETRLRKEFRPRRWSDFARQVIDTSTAQW